MFTWKVSRDNRHPLRRSGPLTLAALITLT